MCAGGCSVKSNSYSRLVECCHVGFVSGLSPFLAASHRSFLNREWQLFLDCSVALTTFAEFGGCFLFFIFYF